MLTLIITRLVLLTGFLCQSNLTVYELIASNADLTVFNSLLATTPEIRKGIASPVFTIFAPTNAAFKELNDTNPEFLKDLQANHGDLVKVFQCKLSGQESRYLISIAHIHM